MAVSEIILSDINRLAVITTLGVSFEAKSD